MAVQEWWKDAGPVICRENPVLAQEFHFFDSINYPEDETAKTVFMTSGAEKTALEQDSRTQADLAGLHTQQNDFSTNIERQLQNLKIKLQALA